MAAIDPLVMASEFGTKRAGQETLWKSIEAALLAHHHEPDLEAARVLYSAVAAHRLKGQPVWVMMVAPPASMKTGLLTALDGVHQVHLIDRLTPNTFLSGQLEESKKPRQASSSLLHRIGPSGIVAFPDFSTITAMNRDHRASVLADMRRIFDGRLRREFGTAEHLAEREWRGRLTFLAAATPDIDRYYAVFQVLGERFPMVRWQRPGGIEAALRAMEQDSVLAQKELKSAVHRMFDGLATATEPEILPEMRLMIANIAEFTVRARTFVPRSGYSKGVIYVPEAEAATRVAQQLAQLVRGSAYLGGRDEADIGDFRLAQRAGLDCIPATRRKVIEALSRGESLTPAQLCIPKATLHYALEELQCQDLLVGERLSDYAASSSSDLASANLYDATLRPNRTIDRQQSSRVGFVFRNGMVFQALNYATYNL